MSNAKHLDYLLSAYVWAHIHSKDNPETRVGALALGAIPTDIAMGYCGFPPGIKHDHRMQDRDLKDWMSVHAEVNALSNARFDVQTLYVTHAPCRKCAAQILCMARMLDTIVILERPGYDSKWCHNTGQGKELLLEASVEYIVIPWVEFVEHRRNKLIPAMA